MVQPSGAAADSGSSDSRPTGTTVAAAMPRSARRPASGPSSSRRRISMVLRHGRRELVQITRHLADQVAAAHLTRRVPLHQQLGPAARR